MAGHHDHRLGARRQRLLGGDAHQRLAADLGQQLVRPAHAGGAAGGEHDGGDAVLVGGDRLVARLRPRDDLHQQAADAHAR